MGGEGYTTVFNYPVYQLLQGQFLQIIQPSTKEKWPDGNGEKQIILQGIRERQVCSPFMASRTHAYMPST